MATSEPLADLTSRLLAEAQTLPLTSPAVARFAAARPIEALQEALQRAVAEMDVPASTALALAIGAAGGRISAAHALWLLPEVESISIMPIIAGLVEGDRLATLLAVVEGQRASWEREALVLYLATLLLDGAEPPRKMLSALRSLAREPLSTGAGLLVGLAASKLGDPDLDLLTVGMRAVAAEADQKGLHRAMTAGFFAPVLDSLPEEEARISGVGYTVVRAEPKVGRNDPCPCGSGKKYKKCCEGKAQEAVSAPTMLEQFHKLGTKGGRAREQLFDRLRPGDLAQLDPGELSTLQLIGGYRKFITHHRWDDAERFVEALSKRSDLPGDEDANGYRLELIDQSLEAGNAECAQRQFARGTFDEDETTRFQMNLALHLKSPGALQLVEAVATMGHHGDTSLLIDCAFGLLHHYPGLGILAARGCIHSDRLLDSEMLLMEIDRARDRLDLSPHEPWWDLYERLLDESLEPGQSERDGEEDDRHQREIDEMRANLRSAQARVGRLDAELSKRVTELQSLSSEREQLAAIVEASRGGEYQKRVSELEVDRQRLRTKIESLKGEISEGAVQRGALRREMAETANAFRTQDRKPPPIESAEVPDGIDDAEGEPAANAPRKIAVPHYTAAASRSLGELPRRVAADALQATAALAAGDAHAWSGVKHMRRAHDILSIRIGRSYRMLFRISEERLDVLDVIHRRGLDALLQRVAGR